MTVTNAAKVQVARQEAIGDAIDALSTVRLVLDELHKETGKVGLTAIDLDVKLSMKSLHELFLFNATVGG